LVIFIGCFDEITDCLVDLGIILEKTCCFFEETTFIFVITTTRTGESTPEKGERSMNTLEKAKELAEILPEVDTKLQPELQSAAFREAIAALEKARGALAASRAAYSTAVDQARDADRKVRELMARIKAGVKSAYGPDSLEYQKIGGKRSSEIARRPRSKNT